MQDANSLAIPAKNFVEYRVLSRTVEVFLLQVLSHSFERTLFTFLPFKIFDNFEAEHIFSVPFEHIAKSFFDMMHISADRRQLSYFILFSMIFCKILWRKRFCSVAESVGAWQVLFEQVVASTIDTFERVLRVAQRAVWRE